MKARWEADLKEASLCGDMLERLERRCMRGGMVPLISVVWKSSWSESRRNHWAVELLLRAMLARLAMRRQRGPKAAGTWVAPIMDFAVAPATLKKPPRGWDWCPHYYLPPIVPSQDWEEVGPLVGEPLMPKLS
ncbi:hypothetical protein HYH03_007676 [Edaphochlamys debaryana]|uniref:Uncharacterized protein n=1 Tax=Edaphochlamys debaryana TaxID=47281 RepID=A0A835Y169_9CHLO|nr:hypothetical protein HYH03_007676 [Edaphochlamys debaryana]|eukprot:KAG2494028.1 hypothetical protein HYH03_007676 [Edaphochlamys debaryana]